MCLNNYNNSTRWNNLLGDFQSSSMSWWVSYEPVSARASGSPWAIKHWPRGTFKGRFVCLEESSSTEILLRHFDYASRDGLPNVVVSGCPRLGEGFGECNEKIELGARWAGRKD